MLDFVSLDIETTGTNPELHNVIEIGAVDATSELRIVIVKDCYLIDPFCGHLHTNLWKEISDFRQAHLEDVVWNTVKKCGSDVLSIHDANQTHYTAHLEDAIEILDGYVAGRNLAGKNLASFDLRFLIGWENYPRRIIDVGNLYLKPTDTKIPDLSTCLSRAGLDSTVVHDAVSDAKQVQALVQVWSQHQSHGNTCHDQEEPA